MASRKGSPNRPRALAKVRLEKYGCDLDKIVANAILDNNYELLKALAAILPFYQPKYRDIDSPTATPPMIDVVAVDKAMLLEAAK